MVNHKSPIVLFCVLAIPILAAGCVTSSSGGGTTSSKSLLTGVTALEVTVHAESKSGWQDPRKQSDYTGLRPGEAKAFETVDYTNLNEIVLWLEPQLQPGAAGVVSSAGNLSINLGTTRPNLMVAGRGSIWDFRNATGKAEQVFLRMDSGKVVNLGSIAGPGQSFSPDVVGLVEVMLASKPEPIARVYVAPSAFVRVVAAGTPVMFVALPAGPAKLVAWHPRLPGASTEINLEPGKTTRTSLTIGVNSLPKTP